MGEGAGVGVGGDLGFARNESFACAVVGCITLIIIVDIMSIVVISGGVKNLGGKAIHAADDACPLV